MEIKEQVYNYGKDPPKWCKPSYVHKKPQSKTLKRLEMRIREEEDILSKKVMEGEIESSKYDEELEKIKKEMEWSVPTLPTFSCI